MTLLTGASENRDLAAEYDLRVRRSSVTLFLATAGFAVLGAAFLRLVGEDALNGRNAFQFFADSGTYLQMFREPQLHFDGALVGVSANYLGPLMVLRLVSGNIYLVMLVNLLIFFLSITSITRQLQLDSVKVVGLLALSPLTLSSLLSVNKEIFTFPFVALAILALQRRSLGFALAALIVALLVRWQQAAFWVVLLGMLVARPLVRHRGVQLVALLGGVSAAYLAFTETFAPVLAVVERSIADDWDQGSGLFAGLLALQDDGLYFLVFPVKALHLLFALGLRFDRLFTPTSIYNDVFIVLHCSVSLFVWLAVLRRHAFKLSNDLVFASLVFLIVFCLSPIYAPRYLFPVFVVWVLVLAGAPASIYAGAPGWRGTSDDGAQPLLK